MGGAADPDAGEPILRAAGLSDVGRVRAGNEDAFAILLDHGLLLVSDGMGGHNAGAAASRIVVDLLPKMIAQRVTDAPKEPPDARKIALRDAIVELGARIRAESIGLPGLSGMGATVVLVLLWKEAGLVSNMGDSRAYLWRRGTLTQLTDDHSVVGLLLRKGEITPEEAVGHAAKGRLSRFLGMEGVVYPDVKDLALEPGDRLLLCTDGLTDMLADEAILAALTSEADLPAVCRRLVDAANAAGGKDNVTVVVAEWSRPGVIASA